MDQSEIYEILQRFKYHLGDIIRANFEDYESQILFEIRKLNERIDEIELRLAELEKDRVHKLITMEARRLGMTEEEFLRKVAEFIKEVE